ncbi:MAG: hypothetical protein QNI99_04245 [Woeseiaceae bacterium]|nr:hypothetical protein [Woeseiaceae bacterium]
MLKLVRNRATAFAVAMTLVLSACSSDEPSRSSGAFTDEDSIMRFVPADTPYLLATGSQLPDELLDEIEPEMEVMMGAYRELIRASVDDAISQSETPMSGEELEWIGAILNELTGLVSVEGMRDAGFERDSRMVFFGHGLLPVLRIEVSDAQKFEDMVARIEEAAGQSMNVGEIDGQSYRYAGGDGGNLVLGTFDDNAVFTFLPAMMGDDELRMLLGLTLPDQSIAETSTLSDIAETYGYTDHYIGMIDVMGVVSIFIDEPSGLNAPLLEAFEYDNSGLSNVCREEIRETAGIAPRIVFGYHTISTETLGGSMVIEMREDLAKGLAATAAPVPGLGTDFGGLVSMGMSGDYGATRDFIMDRIDAVEADPYECEFFADMQFGIEQMRAGLNQPLPPVVYSFRGFNVVVDEVEGLDQIARTGQEPSPDSIDGTILVAMEDAQAMVAMGAMFSPELAALDIEPNGEAVSLDLPQVDAMGVSLYAAMVDDAIAVSFGDDAEDRVTAVLDAEIIEPSPVFSMSFDAGAYYTLIADAMMLEPDDEMPVAAQEAVRDLMLALGDIYDRITFDVLFTENGIELDSTVTLAQ